MAFGTYIANKQKEYRVILPVTSQKVDYREVPPPGVTDH